jgi:putative NADH-flavin reductase
VRIVVLGATGRTGRHVVDTALDRGHQLTVLVRDPTRVPGGVVDRVRVVVGDSTDPAAVRDSLTGTDAVVSALGPTAKGKDLHTRTATALVAAMELAGPPRFVGVSGAGIDVPGDRKSTRDVIIGNLIQLVGGAVVKDKPAEYAVWAASGLDWTLVRPPRLLDGPATGAVERSSTVGAVRQHPWHDAHRSPVRTTITRADLAVFLLDVVEQDHYVRQAPFVAGR